MDEKILSLYCLCADCLRALGHAERPQQQMSDAEVVTTALVAMLFFRGYAACLSRSSAGSASIWPRQLSWRLRL